MNSLSVVIFPTCLRFLEVGLGLLVILGGSACRSFEDPGECDGYALSSMTGLASISVRNSQGDAVNVSSIHFQQGNKSGYLSFNTSLDHWEFNADSDVTYQFEIIACERTHTRSASFEFISCVPVDHLDVVIDDIDCVVADVSTTLAGSI